MQPLVRRDIWFSSADKRSRVAGYVYTNPYVTPFCVVQLSHGMCEHVPRYEEFAAFIAEKGVAVCGNDHIGHGESAADETEFGFFGEKDGRLHALEDLKTMNDKAREMFPGLPVVMLGHSMGSFFARKYATLWPNTIDGLVLSGTGGPNPLAGFGIFAAGLLGALRGQRHRSAFVHNLAFGKYLARIENPKTPYDWISKDEAIVAAYAADPKCTFRFTVNGFRELFSALRDVSGEEWAAAMPKGLPVLMIQGDADPVGDYGKGTEKVRRMLKEAGVEDLEYILYPSGRHEMLNEVNRDEVYQDIWEFIETRWGRPRRPLPGQDGQG